MKHNVKKIAIATVALLGLAGQATAQDFALRFQSSDPAGNPNFGLQSPLVQPHST